MADHIMASSATERQSELRSLGPSRSFDAARLPDSVTQTLRGTGEPLDTSVRARLDPRFGADFSRVRVFRDDAAARSAKAINANAYTVGSDVVFAAGKYEPGTSAGQRLIAHELAHVVQNAGQNGTDRPLVHRDAATGVADDDKVQEYIDDVLANLHGDVGDASQALSQMRNDESSCGDENLAAAEHYMFARFLVGQRYFPTVFVSNLILAYDLLKISNYVQYAIFNWVTGQCQASDPGPFSIKWGLKGVRDGRKDRPWWGLW